MTDAVRDGAGAPLDEADALRTFFRDGLLAAARRLPSPDWLRPDPGAQSYWQQREPGAPLVFPEDARPLAQRLAELWRDRPEALRALAPELAALADACARARAAAADRRDDGEPPALIYAMF